MAERQDDTAAAHDRAAETHGFQTEARQLLKLMIHSLYSNREIFLRELISNASDAIDKLRFRAIESPELIADDPDYAITVDFDADAGTLSVADNGIGMSREDVIDHLGTIAKSGTAEFIAKLTGDQKKDAALIGQFGVGFYSAFIVADEVEVLTRAAGSDTGTRWRSAGEDTFTVEGAADLPRGTTVILHLKADAREFADGFRLRSIVRKYSDHIGVPVRLPRAEGDADQGLGDEASQDEASRDESSADATTAQATAADRFEVVNSARALWTRPRTDVTDDEYRAFYKHVSHDFEDPLTWSHNKVEGKLEYTSLLFVPKRAPFDLWNRDVPRGVKLYVQRVFIMDDAEQFLPLYLRFVKGVVDSSDLPLNVSREILQQDERISTIRSALTKRVLSMLQTLADKEPETYQAFWDEFGEVLKEGAGEDFSNREAILKLLRFSSTRDSEPKKQTSLDDYLGRMVDGQDKIYFLVGESWDTVRSSPLLEVFRERGIEVLLLYDRIDEWLMSGLSEYQDKAFQDVTRADLTLPGEPEKQDEESGDDADPLSERIKEALGDRVDKVRRSKRLQSSPACLVLGEFELGPQMRRIMEASGQKLPESRPQFEYNPEHPLIQRLSSETDEERFAELVLVLFDQARLAGGELPQDPGAYVSRLNQLLTALLSD